MNLGGQSNLAVIFQSITTVNVLMSTNVMYMSTVLDISFWKLLTEDVYCPSVIL